MVAAAQLRRSPNAVPFLIPVPDPPTPKSFTCHTSSKSPLNPSIATLPKTCVSKLYACHTSETPRGAWTSPALRPSNAYSSSQTGLRDAQASLMPESSVTKSSVAHPLSSQPLTKCFSRNLCFENDPFSWGAHVPPPAPSRRREPGYLLMSSFASSRFSNGWRNCFVWSGAPLMAIVISFAAFGKSPVFDEIRASARWLIQ